VCHQRVDQGRLAGSRRAREADDVGLSGAVAELLLKPADRGIAAFDQGDRACEGANVPGPKPFR